MQKRRFDAQKALSRIKEICRVSPFIPAGMNPYQLDGQELERYLAVSRARADVVTSRFRALGYTVSRTPVKYRGCKGLNLFAYRGRKNLPGRLLFIGHHDYCAGVGAEDNATALAVMLELARQFSGRALVAFASFELEEPGLVGSHQFVRELVRAKGLNFKAVIDLECLGSGKDIVICEEVCQAKSNPELVAEMKAAARAAGYDLPARSYDYFWADHVPFAKHGMRTLELGSINLSCKLSKRERDAEFRRAARGERRRDGSVAHTSFDVPESISVANLQKVGDVLVQFIERSVLSA